jgi:hypothetical protein
LDDPNARKINTQVYAYCCFSNTELQYPAVRRNRPVSSERTEAGLEVQPNIAAMSVLRLTVVVLRKSSEFEFPEI